MVLSDKEIASAIEKGDLRILPADSGLTLQAWTCVSIARSG